MNIFISYQNLRIRLIFLLFKSAVSPSENATLDKVLKGVANRSGIGHQAVAIAKVPDGGVPTS